MLNIPYDDREGVIWIDGSFVPWRDARIHVLTQGLHYASAVFEGERAYEGRIFRSHDHAQRLHHSCRRLGMALPFDTEALQAAKAEVLARSGLKQAYVRPIVWRGSNEMDISTAKSDVHCAIAAWEWAEETPDPTIGIRMDIAGWRRPSRTSVPCDAKAAGLYMISTMAKDQAQKKGFDDALMLDGRGRITEATGANAFFVRDGVVFTPAPGDFLNGITRQTVIDLVRDAGLELCETELLPEDLGTFSECFLTGTAAEITAVSSIGQNSYQPGPVTQTLVAAYQAAVRAPSCNFTPVTLGAADDTQDIAA